MNGLMLYICTMNSKDKITLLENELNSYSDIIDINLIGSEIATQDFISKSINTIITINLIFIIIYIIIYYNL